MDTLFLVDAAGLQLIRVCDDQLHLQNADRQEFSEQVYAQSRFYACALLLPWHVHHARKNE